MKKILQLLSLLLITQISFAQTVIHGSDIINGELKEGTYFLLKIDDKTLDTEWKTYLNSYGKVSVVDKQNYRLTNFNQANISKEELTIDTKISAFKDFTKIFCVVEKPSRADFNEKAFDEFLFNFISDANFRELTRLAATDLEEAKSYLKDTERDVKKIEKSLESNLKMQEKYGKILDDSPEKLVALLEEKQAIVEQQVVTESTEELAKAASKKEKEIAKNKKNEAKYADKLSKKESEFDELKDELMAAKKLSVIANDLVKAKTQTLKDLKRD